MPQKKDSRVAADPPNALVSPGLMHDPSSEQLRSALEDVEAELASASMGGGKAGGPVSFCRDAERAHSMRVSCASSLPCLIRLATPSSHPSATRFARDQF